MPGKSYNNPQLEYERNKKNYEAEKQRQKTEREKAQLAAANAKKAASLKDQISKNNKTINDLSNLIKSAETTKAGYVSTYNTYYRAAVSPSGPGGATITSGEQLILNQQQSLITGREQVINTTKASIQDLKNKNDALTKQFNQIYNISAVKNYSISANKTLSSSNSSSNRSSSSSSSNAKDAEKEPIKPSKTYKYNLPLIKPARFSSSATSPLKSSMGDNDGFVGAPGASTNVDNYWKGESPGRGVLRVNRDWMKAILNASEDKLTGIKPGDSDPITGSSIKPKKPDPQLYGFRFQYNPEKIQMIYDVNANLHPGVLASGKDIFLPLTQSSSAISLDLIFNRMEDMKYREDAQLAIQRQVYHGSGETASLLKDIKEIHEKGTMYDMEYMFKTMNAPMGEFWSRYNGTTADMGFIRPTILELHLGNRLRYPVRVISLAIEHKIFDPRMVPVFSVVRITFARFIEYETTKPAADPAQAARAAR